MFNKYLVYNKHKLNLNFIYLLRNRFLILVYKIFRRKRIFLVRRYIDVEDEKITNTIERYIAIKIWIKYRLSLNTIYVQNK